MIKALSITQVGCEQGCASEVEENAYQLGRFSHVSFSLRNADVCSDCFGELEVCRRLHCQKRKYIFTCYLSVDSINDLHCASSLLEAS